MEISVADDGPLRRRGAMRHEPSHGGAEPVEPARIDARRELGEIGVEAHEIPAERRTCPIESPQQDFGVERVEPRLHLHEDGAQVELSSFEERPAGQPLHDEECPAEPADICGGQVHAGRRVAQVDEGVLDSSLAERTRRIMLGPEQSQDERPGQRGRSALQPEGEDPGVEASADRRRPLGEIERGLAELSSQELNEPGRDVQSHASDDARRQYLVHVALRTPGDRAVAGGRAHSAGRPIRYTSRRWPIRRTR